MKVAVVGTGGVGTVIGGRLFKKGYTVKYGTRDPASAKVQDILKAQSGVTAETIPEAVKWSDAVVLATPGVPDAEGAKKLAASLGPGVTGKVLIDVTNPLTPWPDLSLYWETNGGKSGGELIAEALPGTFVVKALNTIGVEHIAKGEGDEIGAGQLALLYAGAPEGKEVTEKVVGSLGWAPKYVGPIRYARNLEAIAELWIHLSIAGCGTSETWGRNFHFQAIGKTEP